MDVQKMPRAGLGWIFIQGILFLAYLGWSGGLDLVHEGDSAGYLYAAQLDSLEAWLANTRTFGYPLFLRIVSLVSPDYTLVPWIHFITHIFAVGAFWWGLKEYGFTDRQALLGASPLLYVEAVRFYNPFLLTDSLAVSWAILTIAILLVVVAHRTGRYAWMGLGIACFITYQIRPAYLFLVPFLPCLGGVLLWQRRKSGDRVRVKEMVGRLAIASIGPYLAFCLFRWVTVADFGIASFGGWVQTGITAQMLDDDVAEELPEDVRELGRAIVAQRRKNEEVARRGNEEEIIRLAESLSFKFGNFNTFPNREDFLKDCATCAQPLLGDHSFSMHKWMRCYNYNCITLVMATAVRFYGTDLKVLNQKLGRLSRAIILERPFLFSKWIFKAFLLGTYSGWLATYDGPVFTTPVNPPTFILGLLLVLSDLILVGRRYFLSRYRDGYQLQSQGDGWPELFALIATIGISYYFMGMLLVVLVEPPLTRFVLPLSIFIPGGMLAVALGWKWSALRLVKQEDSLFESSTRQ